MAEKDVQAVAALLAASWRRTYGPIMGAERVAEASSRYHAPNMIAEDLVDPSKKSLIAETGTGIVGCAMSEADPSGAVMVRYGGLAR
jgi:hypothetical protein